MKYILSLLTYKFLTLKVIEHMFFCVEIFYSKCYTYLKVILYIYGVIFRKSLFREGFQ